MIVATIAAAAVSRASRRSAATNAATSTAAITTSTGPVPVASSPNGDDSALAMPGSAAAHAHSTATMTRYGARTRQFCGCSAVGTRSGGCGRRSAHSTADVVTTAASARSTGTGCHPPSHVTVTVAAAAAAIPVVGTIATGT